MCLKLGRWTLITHFIKRLFVQPDPYRTAFTNRWHNRCTGTANRVEGFIQSTLSGKIKIRKVDVRLQLFCDQLVLTELAGLSASESPNHFILFTMAGRCSIPTQLGIITRTNRRDGM